MLHSPRACKAICPSSCCACGHVPKCAKCASISAIQLQTADTWPPPPPAPLPKFAFIMHTSNECVIWLSRAASALPISPSHAAYTCLSRGTDTRGTGPLCAASCVVACVVVRTSAGGSAAGPQHDVSVGEQHVRLPRDWEFSARDGVGTGVGKPGSSVACRDVLCDLQYALPGAMQVGLKVHTPTRPWVHAQFSHPSNHVVQLVGHVVDDARDESQSGGIRAACSSVSTAAHRGGMRLAVRAAHTRCLCAI